ncbi:MAG TPA: aspartate kinase, partial [Thermoanaerobaculia bacterium]|nr:aspartate kinase [Thermoanaerobaculia bacterium]
EDIMRILKFGGTSVANALPAVIDIVRRSASEDRVVVVVSALDGVTRQLGDAIDRAVAREGKHRDFIDSLREIHRESLLAITGAGNWNGSGSTVDSWLARLGELLDGVALLRHCSPQTRDAILGIGERLAVPIVAEALRESGISAIAVDASAFIRTDDAFGRANVDFDITAKLARAQFDRIDRIDRGTIPVVTGFIAATSAGDWTTLGRGGSDYSAAILGHALGADRVEIWTDVDGIMSADPRTVSAASTLERLSYREAEALAAAGARVLHPRTIAPLAPRGVPVAIRNTLRPAGPHTIVGALDSEDGPRVKAITSADLTPASATTLPWHVTSGSIVTLVGEGIGSSATIAVAAANALHAARIHPCLPAIAPTPDSLAIVVAEDDRDDAVRALHDALVLQRRAIHLVIAGATGRVGSALVRQIESLPGQHIDLRVVVAANRRVTRLTLPGGKRDTPAEVSTEWAKTLDLLRHAKLARTLFIDCTASAEVAALYPDLLREGIGIVTPNKIAGAGPLAEWRDLRKLAREGGAVWRYETTVGAALPLLRTIGDLIASGDRLLEVQGVLSGTLSFILASLHDGHSLSASVAEAYARGLTEPDPTIDLGGVDVGRKLLILLREAGVELEPDAIESEPLVPSSITFDGGIDALVEQLRPFDCKWHDRVESSESRAERLVFAATFDGVRARAGIVSVGKGSPLARVRAGENVVVIRTSRYDTVPLTIAGPGAGPEVTAAGVLAEIIGFLPLPARNRAESRKIDVRGEGRGEGKSPT